jgi:hypothetical protein
MALKGERSERKPQLSKTGTKVTRALTAKPGAGSAKTEFANTYGAAGAAITQLGRLRLRLCL